MAPLDNPHPVTLARPAAAPLSPIALLGRLIFYDPRLSRSGKLSCASCHDPNHAYGPPGDVVVPRGGPTLAVAGGRAVPSLRYVDRIPNFGIGPDNPEAEGTPPGAMSARTAGAPLVPRGGLFWDGRTNTFQTQALAPLFNPVEMANVDTAAVARALRRAPYAARFAKLFGTETVRPDARLIDEALFAVGQFESHDPSFHPYSSKYDAYLEGKATLTPEEARGLALFEDPARGNCATCHLSRPAADGQPPTFSDYQYEALAVPRNDSLGPDRDPRYFDLGLCGPIRTDRSRDSQYCGMFRTPSLRNAATRRVFFHNGIYHTLEDVLRFYVLRDTRPEEIYPRDSAGTVRRYDDLPRAYWGNVDTVDAPFGRHPGDPPALTEPEIRAIVAFLGTLTDGYHP